MNTESFEIDFINVDSGEKSGDAITFRYGDFADPMKQNVIVIDGGALKTVEILVEHIKNRYGTTYVDLVVCTHPDGDHASGLRVVLKELNVGKLWVHRPWEHSEAIRDLFQDGRLTDNSLSEKLRNAYAFAHELEEIAIEKGIKIEEPFEGQIFGYGEIRVLGPSKDFYRELIPDFVRSPEAKESVFSRAFGVVKEAVTNWVDETFEIETLDESGETSAENNSSAVLLVTLNDRRYLFTGDSGIPALKNVIDYARSCEIDLSQLTWLQAPHHGSRRNVSPSVLNEIKAPVVFISAAADSEKHPSKKVVNAFIRRGSRVFSTEGKNIWHQRNAPTRPDYGPIESLPFNYKVPE